MDEFTAENGDNGYFSASIDLDLKFTCLPEKDPLYEIKLESLPIDITYDNLVNEICANNQAFENFSQYIGINIITESGTKFFGMANRSLKDIINVQNTVKKSKLNERIKGEIELIIVPNNLRSLLQKDRIFFAIIFADTMMKLREGKFGSQGHDFQKFSAFYQNHDFLDQTSEAISSRLEIYAEFATKVDSLKDFYAFSFEACHIDLLKNKRKTGRVTFNSQSFLKIEPTNSTQKDVIKINLFDTYFLDIRKHSEKTFIWVAILDRCSREPVSNFVFVVESFDVANRFYTKVFKQCSLIEEDFTQRVLQHTHENQQQLKHEYKKLANFLNAPQQELVASQGISKLNNYLSVMSHVTETLSNTVGSKNNYRKSLFSRSKSSESGATPYDYEDKSDNEDYANNFRINGVYLLDKTCVTCKGTYKGKKAGIKSALDQIKESHSIIFEAKMMKYMASEHISKVLFVRNLAPSILCFSLNYQMTVDKYIAQESAKDQKCTHKLALQLMNAMKHLLRMKVVHRSIMKESLFVNERGKLKLFNFQYAKISMSMQFYDKANELPLKSHSAPESLLARVYSDRSDLWDGCVTILMMSNPALTFFSNKKAAFDFFLNYTDQKFAVLKSGLPVAFKFQFALEQLEYAVEKRGTVIQTINILRGMVIEEKEVVEVAIFPEMATIYESSGQILQEMKDFLNHQDNKFIDFKNYFDKISAKLPQILDQADKLPDGHRNKIEQHVSKLRQNLMCMLPKELKNYELNKRNALSAQNRKRVVDRLNESKGYLTNINNSCTFTVKSKVAISSP